ncbi:MAG: hypothetical protein AAF196_20745 [Planctomycetota bacterium]
MTQRVLVRDKSTKSIPQDEGLKVAEEAINRFREAFSLTDWRIYAETHDLDPGNLANCSILDAYQKATIRIDVTQHESEEEVVESVRHEMIHLLLSPIEFVVDRVGQMERSDLSAAACEGVERSVRMIEKAMDGLAKASK